MDDYLSKPFTEQQLIDVLSRWLEPETLAEASIMFDGDTEGPRDELPDRLEIEPAGAAVDDSAIALDPSIVEPIRAGKPGLWRRLVSAYMDTTPDGLVTIEKALAHSDCTTVQSVAHTIKSASANMGASRLSDLCRQLESAAGESKLEASQELFARIRREFENVSSALVRDDEVDENPVESIA